MDTLFQTSLIAAFIAGIVALFAPCCISFLLPAYLGNVIKEKEKVVLMTLIFGAGIFVVMMPAVLGVAALSKFLFENHDVIYYLGGIIMIISGTISFLGLKFPMPNLPWRDTKKTDPVSIFLLGIFSGITSACCAPVLIGILTLTFLSSSFLGALTIGAMYVLGMVIPLLLIAVFLSAHIKKFYLLRRPAFTLKFLNKEKPVILSNLIASVVFFFTGILIIYLTWNGTLGMSNNDTFSRMIKNVTYSVDNLIGNSLILNGLFVILIIYVLYKISKKI